MAPRKKRIEMVDGIPRYPEDDVSWICQHLPAIEPQSISGFMRHMGVSTRSLTSSGPSPAYYRIAAAFKRGQDMGRLTKSIGRKSWRVAQRQARAS